MKVLLNWLPPAMDNRPSPAMSILQSYLLTYGIDTHVKYWNILFADIIRGFINENDETSDISQLIPFLGNVALELNDKDAFNMLTNEYKSKFPQYININKDYYSNKILRESEAINELLYSELIKMSIKDYTLVGITSKFHQWISGNILVKQAKSINPELKFVLGGLGSKKEALAMMRNFQSYDFAIWGEGEYPLLQLCKYLNNEIDINEIPNLLYRDENSIIDTKQPNKCYLDLDKISPNHFEYFSQQKIEKLDSTEIQIEGGRGCHWQKCRFCFLNSGYKYRTKSAQIIAKEIEDTIEKYGVTNFVFVDNDIIGNNFEKFNHLLDLLLEIREKNESFQINNAEVITFGINSTIIKKMSLAGFKSVQIGYEALSDNLLTKINKKNTFSSNVLFIKWAIQFNIKTDGANIIQNLLEETDEDILISSQNLHFLRFFLKKGTFQHSFSSLSIASTSRYFKTIVQKKEESRWNNYKLAKLLPANYFIESDRFDILFFGENYANPLWGNVKTNEAYYLKNEYTYSLLTNNNQIDYNEFYNGELINGLQFDRESIHWQILTLCNHKTLSISELKNRINSQIDIDSLKSTIKELNAEWLIYSREDFSENVTIINTDLLL